MSANSIVVGLSDNQCHRASFVQAGHLARTAIRKSGSTQKLAAQKLCSACWQLILAGHCRQLILAGRCLRSACSKCMLIELSSLLQPSEGVLARTSMPQDTNCQASSSSRTCSFHLSCRIVLQEKRELWLCRDKLLHTRTSSFGGRFWRLGDPTLKSHFTDLTRNECARCSVEFTEQVLQ